MSSQGYAATIRRSVWLNACAMLMVSSLDVLVLLSNAKTLDLAGALWAVSFVLAFPVSLGAVLGVALGVVVHAIEASATGKRVRRVLYYWMCLVAAPVTIVVDFLLHRWDTLSGGALWFVLIGLFMAM